MHSRSADCACSSLSTGTEAGSGDLRTAEVGRGALEVGAVDGELLGALLGGEHIYGPAKAHDVDVWWQVPLQTPHAGHPWHQQLLSISIAPCEHIPQLQVRQQGNRQAFAAYSPRCSLSTHPHKPGLNDSNLTTYVLKPGF